MRYVCAALSLLVVVVASSGCQSEPGADALIAEAQVLRLRFEKQAGSDAIEKYRQAIARARGLDARLAAIAAQGLGATFYELGRLRESFAAYVEALALAERANDPLLQSEVRAELGFARAWVGEGAAALDDAERECQEALSTARSLGGLRQEAKALVCLGEVIYTRGSSFEPALDIQRQAEAIWDQLGNQGGVAQARLAQGWLYSDRRQFDNARTAFDQARAAWAIVADQRGLAITLVAEARLMERRGEYQDALTSYHRASEMLDRIGDAVWHGSSLAGIATIHQYRADNARARDFFQRALGMAKESGQSVFAMDMLTALGNVHLSSGDEAAALARFDEAHALAVAMKNTRWQAWALKYAGEAHLARRAFPEAERSLEQALALLPGLDEKWLEAQALSGLAEASDRIGEHERAYAQAQRALAVSQDAGDRVFVARSMAALGVLATRQGRLAQAQQSLATALADFQSLFGSGHPLVADTRVALAELQLANGRVDDALSEALDAERNSLDHERLTVRYLPERQALAFAARRPRGLDLAVSAAANGSAQQMVRVYDLVIQSRGVVLDELASRGRSRTDTNPRLVELQAQASRARQRFANLLVRGLEGQVPQGELEDARIEKEEAERSLAAESVEARIEMARAQADFSAVRRSMPSDATLVSFIEYARHDRPASHGSAPLPPVRSFAAFISRASGPVTLVRLGSVDELELLVAQWRFEASGGTLLRRESNVDPERAYRQAGERLRRAVWDPVAAHTRGAARIIVVPDGALSLVSFAGLPLGESTFLAERGVPIHYITAERDLVLAPLPTRSGGMLALGGPAFDDGPGSPPTVQALPRLNPPGEEPPDSLPSAPPCQGPGRIRFEPLHGTLQEVEELVPLWSDAAPGLTPRLLVGAQASESEFKRAAGSHRFLHLATHGFFVSGLCAPGTMVASNRGVGVLSSAKPLGNPLRLSGLALAGANRRAPSVANEDDGILTAEEVAMLDLHGVEWAVLSACDTGVGEIKAGEGVFGLRRAFQVAGARTVIMSLWSVDDQATRTWMRALYEGRFQRQLSTADAVHQASLTVLRDRRAKGQSTHPFFWAAFVAAGDWR